MKIAVVVPNSTMPPEVLELRRAFLQANAAKGTEIVVWRNDAGPESIETEAERDEAAVEIMRNIRGRDLSGIDALIPWCAADPALDSLRQELAIPVVGPLAASCAAAAHIGRSFSVVIPCGDVRLTAARISGYGYGGALLGTSSLDTPVLELRADLAATMSRIATRVDAAAEAGAGAVVLGCMALFGVPRQLHTRIPVIDPALAALTTCEAWVRMGITNSLRAAN